MDDLIKLDCIYRLVDFYVNWDNARWILIVIGFIFLFRKIIEGSFIN
jgi:hypothetical protein